MNTQTPIEKLKSAKNLNKVIKTFESNTLNADPVFVVETLRAIERTLPGYVKLVEGVDKKAARINNSRLNL
jgi:hypothetical protein